MSRISSVKRLTFTACRRQAFRKPWPHLLIPEISWKSN